MSAYSDAVLADGAIAYWRCNDLTSMLADSGPNGLTGTWAAAVMLQTSGAIVNDADTGVSLDGVSAAGVIPMNPADVLSSNFALEVWIAPALAGVNHDQLILSTDAAIPNYLGVLSTGRLQAGFQIQNKGVTVTGMTPVEDFGVWHHVVVQRHDGVLELYRNGVLDGSISVNNVQPTKWDATQVLIGTDRTQSRYYFAGAVDEIAFYPFALDPSVIAARFTYQNPAPIDGGGDLPPAGLDADPGSATANSYETVADFRAYCATKPYAPVPLPDDATIAAQLIEGTRILDNALGTEVDLTVAQAKGQAVIYAWTGAATDPAVQALCWPRTGMRSRTGFPILPTVVPQGVKDCVSEIVLANLQTDLTKASTASMAASGIKDVTAGSVSVSFGEVNAANSTTVTPQGIPDAALAQLVPSWYQIAVAATAGGTTGQTVGFDFAAMGGTPRWP